MIKRSLLSPVAAFAFATTALLFSSTTAIQAAPPAIGSAAPDFQLTDTNGKTHTLAEHKGKYVVLEWTNPECPFVKKHYSSGNMQKLQAEYTKKGVVWLSIDSSAQGSEGYVNAAQGNAWLKEVGRKADGTIARRGRQSWTFVRCHGHSGHVHHRPGGQIALRRSD